jgi:uncharacterized SAM-binding protein YcdF (DUF218 family)
VVLGARVLASGEASPALRERVDKAVALYRQGLAPALVFTGGVAGTLPSEAAAARALAVEAGVPPTACHLEERSHSTLQNAQGAAPMLRSLGARRVLLVSDGYHLRRGAALFTQEGFAVQPIASERQLGLGDAVYWTVREAAALLRSPWLLWR